MHQTRWGSFITRLRIKRVVFFLLDRRQVLGEAAPEDFPKLKERIEKLEADNVAMKKELAQLQAKLPALEKKSGQSPFEEPLVLAMIPYRGGLLTAFSNCDGKPGLYRVQSSRDGQKPAEGE